MLNGMAYSSVVAAELFNGIPGVGGLVKDASNYNNTPVVLVGIFAIGISGLIIDGLLRGVGGEITGSVLAKVAGLRPPAAQIQAAVDGAMTER